MRGHVESYFILLWSHKGGEQTDLISSRRRLDFGTLSLIKTTRSPWRNALTHAHQRAVCSDVLALAWPGIHGFGSKNLEPGQKPASVSAWLWPESYQAMAFGGDLMPIHGFGLAKSQARPRPTLAEARQSQSQAKKPWLFGLRPKPEHH